MSDIEDTDSGAARTTRADDVVTVTVCRGCCCGSDSKHPEVDHDAQLQALRSEAGAGVRVRVSDCLDACDWSNVMVVTPSASGRRAGARPVWFGGVLDEESTSGIARWASSGGPGLRAPEDLLRSHELRDRALRRVQG